MKQTTQITQPNLQSQVQMDYKKMLGIGSNYSQSVGKIRYYLNLIIKNFKALLTTLYERGILIVIVLIISGFVIHFALTHFIAFNNSFSNIESFKNFNYFKRAKKKTNKNHKNKNHKNKKKNKKFIIKE